MKKILNVHDNMWHLFDTRPRPARQESPASESEADQILRELNEMENAEERFVQSIRSERLGLD